MAKRKKGVPRTQANLEEALEKVTVKTFYMTNAKMMISKEGWCVFKRSLWKEGQYIGIVERVVCDESVKHEVAIPQYQMGKQMPVSEYEIVFHPRSDQ